MSPYKTNENGDEPAELHSRRPTGPAKRLALRLTV